MKIQGILSGLITGALLLSACAGDDGKQMTATTPTGATNSNSNSNSDSNSGTDSMTAGETTGTTGGGSMTASMSGTTTADPTTGATDATGSTTCSIFDCGTGMDIAAGCDIWAQDCPDGEKCTAWADDGGSSWNANKCVPVNPDPKQSGDACTAEGSGVSGLDDCDKGQMCWNTNEENIGYCIEFCMGSADAPFCSDPQALCAIANDGVLPICLPSCDPLLQDCPGDDACLPLNDGFVCVLDASGPDAGVDGDPCEFANACDPGLFCANADFVPGCMAAGCCSSFCDLDAPNMCPLMGQGAECVPFYEMGMAPPGKENLGGCGIPG